jgi:chromosome segregation ATPase
MMHEDILNTLRNIKEGPYVLASIREGMNGIEQIMARAADEIERLRTENADLRAETESFHMDYRMKCDEETKAQANEIARLRAENAELREKLVRCMASRDALRDWAQECRNKVLMPVSDRADDLGITADGLGQWLVTLRKEK